MAAAKDELAALIQACADASGSDALRLAIGAPGQKLLFQGETELTGQAYVDPGFLDCLLEGLGQQLDKTRTVWASILTNATGVAPTVSGNSGVSGATKNEGTDILTVSFSPAFASGDWGGSVTLVGTTFWSYELLAASASSLQVQFRDMTDGSIRNINGKLVRVLVVGAI